MVRRFGRSLSYVLALAFVVGCDSSPNEPAKDNAATPSPATAAPAATAPRAAAPGGAWNSAQIDWKPFDQGMALAKSASKPVLLVVSASWCPHCRNYAHVFDDPRVVDKAKGFVMIHIDSDEQADVAAKYARDGGYIPRTYFLAPDGSVENVRASNPRFQYFYDEKDPSPLLGGMGAALAVK